MLKLPQMPFEVPKTEQDIVRMRGINYGNNLSPGDMADSLNISAARYPYITTRKAREQKNEYYGVTALTAWDKLVAVQGTDLLYDGEVVGQVTEGQKQFATINTQMVIWPDKVYLDLTTKTIHPLGAELSGTGAVFTTNTMTVEGWGDLTEKFKAGDVVNISGNAEEKNNKDILIKELTATVLTVSDNGFTEATETGEITIKREVPDMDYICASGNRIFGCSSDKQSIYASAQGESWNWNVFENVSTDSYALAISSPGKFTGCCKLGRAVLFWKENALHKLMGDTPAEFAMNDYTIEGLKDGCYKSMQVVNEVLFYMGIHGVYAYSNATPQLMSENFGVKDFTDAVGGNDGDSYYLAVKEGDSSHLLVYETRHGIWVREDDIYCTDFARIGRDLYFLLDDGTVHLSNTQEDLEDIPWGVQFAPFYESTNSKAGAVKKVHSNLTFRLELPEQSYVSVSVRYDGKTWREVKKVLGSVNNLVNVPLPMQRCDKFEVKLDGKGPCTILAMVREYRSSTEL